MGAAPGERVEVLSVEGSDAPIEPGDTGTLLSIDGDCVRVLFDSGAELALDPFVVRFGPVLRRSA